ncbi:MAG: hypothetical protein JW969_08095 [Spirochaetales bacterium]|nr:hypothetical protein [Spirochaetales bacterium]
MSGIQTETTLDSGGGLYLRTHGGQSKPRMLLGMEHFVPCVMGTPPAGCPDYSSGDRKNPPYEMGLSRYKLIFGMSVPNTERYVLNYNRPMDVSENHFLGWTTLTHADFNLP